jgi:DNA invertase Pin-like site-specific DNA recombinase
VESARDISRKASQGEELYNIAKEKGVSIICSDFPKLFALQPSPIESFMRKLVLAMQELDRDVLVERMQAGLAAKKKQQRQGHNQGPQRSMVASLLYSC